MLVNPYLANKLSTLSTFKLGKTSTFECGFFCLHKIIHNFFIVSVLPLYFASFRQFP